MHKINMNNGDFIDADLNSRAYTKQYFIAQGWECPRCHKVNSPSLMQCFCNANQPYTWITDPLRPTCIYNGTNIAESKQTFDGQLTINFDTNV